MSSLNRKEVSHYVVTAFPPGAVLHTTTCSGFTSETSKDVIIAKSRGLEIRTCPTTVESSQQFLPLVTSIPIHGRIASLHSIPWQQNRSLLFVTTERWQYAVIGYDEENKSTSPYPLVTHASGSLSATNLTQSVATSVSSTAGAGGGGTAAGGGGSGSANNEGPPLLGREAETGPIVAIHARCIVLHIFEGILTVLPINPAYQPTKSGSLKAGSTSTTMTPPRHSATSSFLGQPFHCRVEERTILALTFVPTHTSAVTGSPLPQLAVLYQDARGVQHMTTHMIHVGRQQLYLHGSSSVPPNSPAWWKKTAVDGGSAMLLPVPPRVPASMPARSARGAAASTTTTGGVLMVGQRQLTYCAPSAPTKIIPVPQALYLAATELPPDPDGGGLPRYLLADEFGNLHMLSLVVVGQSDSPTNHIQGLQLETLGSCNLATSLAYLGQGLVFVGSAMGDSQLVQIHDEPFSEQGAVKKDSNDDNDDGDDEDMALLETTYLQVLEEFPNLGPILDFDLIPTTLGGASTNATGTNPGGNSHSGKELAHQPVVPSQVVTASGSSKSGTIRLIRNGIGMKESASVDIPGISQMWSLRQSFTDAADTYLVQSFVGETRVLGVVETGYREEGSQDRMAEDGEEEVGGALEEVLLPGLDSTVPTLYMGNLEAGNRWLQITPRQIRLLAATTPNDMATGDNVLDSWHVSNKSSLVSNPVITVATANEAGQVAISLSGGYVLYFCTTQDKIHSVSEHKMDQEVSCLDLHPFHHSSESGAMTDDEDVHTAAEESRMLAIGLWDDFTVRLLSLENQLEELLKIRLQEETENEEEEASSAAAATPATRNHRNQMMMARSLCLITLDFSSANNNANNSGSTPGVDMLFVGLGDGTLISFAVVLREGRVSVQAKKEVCLGTQRIDLVPLSTNRGGTCVMATGDRPTVIYLAGVSGGSSAYQVNPKLCYSNVNLSPSEDEDGSEGVQQTSEQCISVNSAAPFFSPLLFVSESLGSQHYSLCVADDTSLRLGIIDDIQKLHVTTCRLGMAPRRIVHCPEGRLFAVGCVESGIKHVGLGGPETNSMSNCIRFMDDTTFEDIDRVDLEPYETIMSMAHVSLLVPKTQDSSGDTYRQFLLMGTAYVLPDEDEPTRGKIMVYSCEADTSTPGSPNRQVRQVTELFTQGSVYSICQFYQGTALCTVNTKTMIAKLVDDTGVPRLQFIGTGHHGHILSYSVRSMAEPCSSETSGSSPQQTMAIEGEDSGKEGDNKEMLAIVGDLMRSIGLVQYYPEHSTLEEIARDFNPNWTTAMEMLTEDVYLGAENWGNFFCLRRNKAATSEEVRFRLDSIGEFNLGEMCNKFMRGSLVMPVSSTNNSSSNRRALRRTGTPQKGKDSAKAASSQRMQRPVVVTGSQTLFGTTDGTLGVVLGLDSRTAAFFACLEKAMSRVVRPVGDFGHDLFRSCKTERRTHPAHGFVDGDLVETFVDLDRELMESVVKDMNRDGSWEVDDVALRSEDDKETEDEIFSVELTVDDVLSMVEEISMLH